MDTMQGNKATMQLKRISSIVMIPIAKQVIHAALGRKQAMPNNRLTPLPSSALTCTPTELPLSPEVIPAETATTPWEKGKVTNHQTAQQSLQTRSTRRP